MNQTIHAVFSAGVFRPLEPVELAEGTPAQVILLPQATPDQPSPARAPITAWPSNYFEQTAGALIDERFERPSQGDQEPREPW